MRARPWALFERFHIVTDFAALGVAETILRALSKEGYETPTPIQAQAIPDLMKGRDLLGIAQTGTGKTAAFALPILTRFAAERKVAEPRHARALVMAPTRELAAQISESFRAYGRFMGVHVATVVGGVSYSGQLKALHRGVDVLVATPGRLLDHLEAGNVRLDKTDIVVLDEADHMFDLGFIVPIRKILSKLPKKRQSLFFSATMPKEIASLAAEFLHNPVEVAVTPVATTADRVRQEVIMVDGGAKQTILVELLKRQEFQRTIVFTRTKRGAGPRLQDARSFGHFSGGHPWQQEPGPAPAGARGLQTGQGARACRGPISRHAASTCRACLTWSISNCRRCRKIMCIASAARPAPAPKALRCHCARMPSAACCAPSRN